MVGTPFGSNGGGGLKSHVSFDRRRSTAGWRWCGGVWTGGSTERQRGSTAGRAFDCRRVHRTSSDGRRNGRLAHCLGAMGEDGPNDARWYGVIDRRMAWADGCDLSGGVLYGMARRVGILGRWIGGGTYNIPYML